MTNDERKAAELKEMEDKEDLEADKAKAKAAAAKPTDDILTYYNIEKKRIGFGTLADGVYACESKLTGEKFCVKILDINILKETDKGKYFREVSLLKTVVHPAIVDFERYFYNTEKFYILTELCKGGELFNEVNKRRTKKLPKLTEKQVHDIMKDLLSAVSALHSNGIIHRDIKAENICFPIKGNFD